MLPATEIFILGFLFCMAVSFLSFTFISRKNNFSPNNIFIATNLVICIFLSIFTLFFWSKADFISDINQISFITPAIIMTILSLFTLISSNQLIQFILLLISCGGISFGYNIYITFYSTNLHIINQTSTIVLWLIICYIPRVLNINIKYLSILVITISIGSVLLSLIKALPFAVGMMGLSTGTCFLILYNFSKNYPKLQISETMCNLIGFLLGWLIIYASAEGCGICFAVFSIYPLTEAIIAICLKMTFLPRYSNVKNNTIYNFIINKNIPSAIINRNLLRICATSVLFGTFQAFVTNNHSLTLVAFIIILWQTFQLMTLTNNIETANNNTKKAPKKPKKKAANK